VSDLLKRYDLWLEDGGPAALVMREYLMPVEGPDGVLFPATFAAGDGFAGGYNIDRFQDGSSVCLIDSIGSQGNRIEPLFMAGEYAGLVPQIVIIAGQKRVNLLGAGHRAGDAVVRCSALGEELQKAFKDVLKGNADPLAKIAPTSLLFGVWDSRDTQAKLPRLISSTIRAFNVRELTRSAVYVPPVDYVSEDLLAEPGDLRDSTGNVKVKHPFAQRGYTHHPASGTHGGIIAESIRRDASLHLGALRLLAAGDDQQKTRALRRYVLGLALAAFTYSPSGYLRQGCNLVLDQDRPREFSEVYGDGRRIPAAVTQEEALNYAKAAASKFGIGIDREVPFDKEKARADISGESRKSGKKSANVSKAGK
jgi:CRISPR-associated protein Csb1